MKEPRVISLNEDILSLISFIVRVEFENFLNTSLLGLEVTKIV